MKLLKRFSAVILAICMAFQLTACGVADTAKDTAEKAKDTAEKAADKAKEKAGQAKDQVVEWYEQIDFDKFKQGWDKTFDDYAKKNGSKRAESRSKAYTETLDNLKDRLEAPDGTSSKPMTYDDMQAIAELSQKGEFDPEDFGITTSQIITPKHIVKQSINAGLTSAALNTVFTIGPDIFTILKEAAKNGNFDEAQLKQVGVDGLLAGSEGFVEGSVSCAILTACQAGKFGTNLTNASPEVIGTLTVLAIDAIRYGYALSKGEITALDYSNLMTEEIVVAIVSQASGAALQMMLPAVPFAYMAGCMAGGMLATAGLQTVKDIVMEVKDGGGFEAIVPANTVQTMNVITDKISDLHITDQLSGFKDTVISTANNGYITIKSKVS